VRLNAQSNRMELFKLGFGVLWLPRFISEHFSNSVSKLLDVDNPRVFGS